MRGDSAAGGDQATGSSRSSRTVPLRLLAKAASVDRRRSGPDGRPARPFTILVVGCGPARSTLGMGPHVVSGAHAANVIEW